jgi:hypothetical protein
LSATWWNSLPPQKEEQETKILFKEGDEILPVKAGGISVFLN